MTTKFPAAFASRAGRLAGIATLCAMCGAVTAAEWTPSERIIFVSQSSPGTGNELMLREIADIWNKNKFVPKLVSVENVTGAQGEKARRYVITQNRSNPHMLMAFTPPSLTGPLLLKSDTGWRQFTPVAMLAMDTMVILVNAEGPFKSLKDLVATAREKPKSVLQGGANYGNSSSMAGKLLEEAAGVTFSYTPFKGGGEAVLALLGKHVHFIIENPAEVEQHVKAGKLKVVAVSNHLDLFPDAPTVAEAGLKMRVLKQFRSLMAPPAISTEVVQSYLRLLERTRQTQQWKDYLKRTALVENWMTGAELAAYYEQEEREYARLVKDMGLMK
jgi:tripartite-type tricarboxylate transporter receptor subunit TctC